MMGVLCLAGCQGAADGRPEIGSATGALQSSDADAGQDYAESDESDGESTYKIDLFACTRCRRNCDTVGCTPRGEARCRATCQRGFSVSLE